MTEEHIVIKVKILDLLRKEGFISGHCFQNRREVISFQALSGDGSSRRFFRVCVEKQPICIAVLSPTTASKDMAEFKAAYNIANHLKSIDIPVPTVLAVDDNQGLILFEDFGDIRLQDIVYSDRSDVISLYKRVIKILTLMQIEGAKEFNQEWCFDTPVYDKEVMLARESGYFISAFWEETLFAEFVDGIKNEFTALADLVVEYSELMFLHRDFQSRNIMIKGDEIGIIDFQAARLGPPGYDIASLLIDPYAALSDEVQSELFEFYLEEMKRFPGVDTARIRLSYPYLAVQRNLQIIGAFAYLSGRKRKPFFKPYILPSLILLQNRLAENEFAGFPILRKTVSSAILKFRRYLKG